VSFLEAFKEARRDASPTSNRVVLRVVRTAFPFVGGLILAWGFSIGSQGVHFLLTMVVAAGVTAMGVLAKRWLVPREGFVVTRARTDDIWERVQTVAPIENAKGYPCDACGEDTQRPFEVRIGKRGTTFVYECPSCLSMLAVAQ
jgi:hypothetical protein